MLSPLGPTLANLFMGYHKNKWLNSEKSFTVFFYKPYGDEISFLFKSETDAQRFLIFLNEQHPNTKFTIGNEKDNQIPFLDILNDKTYIYRIINKLQ